MFDILIRNAHIVDGTGAPPFDGDIAIHQGRIHEVGRGLSGVARETIDAAGRLVVPGFVDIHTHYDGQVTWDDELKPSSDHGVTTVVMGCCGVGFAPVRPGTEPWLIQLMEGVEDIPGTALTEGIEWQWESFPEYLDALARRKYAIDVAAQVPHGALRFYVMGERGANDEPATDREVATIARLVREAIDAGAVGFTSSRIMGHQAIDGRPVPGTQAAEEELMAIAREMRKAGRGVFEVIPSGTIGEVPGIPKDRFTPQQEFGWMRRFAQASGRPVTFTVAQVYSEPESYRELLEMQDAAVRDGLPLHGQFPVRPGGVLTSLQTYHAFTARPTYKKLAALPLERRVAEMRKPELRRAILAERDEPRSSAVHDNFHQNLQASLEFIYPMREPVDYEPELSRSIGGMARARGVEPLGLMYDMLLEDDGQAVLIGLLANFKSNDHRAIEFMLENANAVPGLGDGGAHAKLICDASSSTYLLTHWARDRWRGKQFPIELLVKKHANDTARLYGLHDRGTLAVGKRADLNVIDFDRLRIGVPRLVADLPAGGQRYLQSSEGYDYTVVNGEPTRREGKDTGLRPGRLVRS